MARLSVDEYGAALAHVVKLRAACTRRQVGAVIIAEDGRIAATGYNGVPSGLRHCDEGGCPRGQFSHSQIPAGLGSSHPVACFAIHAERNAVDYATQRGTELGTCTIYVTETPCTDCKALLSESGLRVVIV